MVEETRAELYYQKSSLGTRAWWIELCHQKLKGLDDWSYARSDDWTILSNILHVRQLLMVLTRYQGWFFILWCGIALSYLKGLGVCASPSPRPRRERFQSFSWLLHHFAHSVEQSKFYSDTSFSWMVILRGDIMNGKRLSILDQEWCWCWWKCDDYDNEDGDEYCGFKIDIYCLTSLGRASGQQACSQGRQSGKIQY